MSIRSLALASLLILSQLAASGAQSARSPQIPFTFIENSGQTDASVRYLGLGSDLKAWFLDSSAVFERGGVSVHVTFQPSGSGRNSVRATDELPGKANYITGSDPNGWRRDLSTFATIRYTGIWPGIELRYRAGNTGLTTELGLSAESDISQIRLRFDGAPQIREDGALVIHEGSGDFVMETPYVCRDGLGGQKRIAAAYRINPDGSVGVAEISGGNRPSASILLSGYFGGSSEDDITAVAIDPSNNIVVAGWTSSSNLPASAGFQKKYGGSVDAFVASFKPNGGGLNYCTYLGGSGDDRAFALALDSSGNVYITGWTSSTNFPVLAPIRSHLGGTRDAFVTKLAAAGNALVYSTYLGGSGVDAGYSIALTKTTNYAVVVGDTTSADFPVTSGVVQTQPGGGQDAFVAMISPAGNTLTFATYLGGNGIDHAAAVKVGSSGGIFVGGYTWSTNFPVLNAQQPYSGGGQDGFVVKLNPTATKFYWSTYLGGSGGSSGAPEEVNALTLDVSSNVVVAGTTSSPNFPVTPGTFQTTINGVTDGFVARIANSSGYIMQCTYLGGSLADSINAVTTDFHNYIYVTGSTSSPDFPVQWPFQATNAGLLDAFVVKMNTTLSSVMFGTYLGGVGSDQGNAIAVDVETSMIVAGQTSSPNYPVTGTLQNFLPSVLTSFITKIQPDFTLGVAYPNSTQMEFTADPWHVMTDTASTFYGVSTDIPIVGDWTGTGVKRIGIFRNGTWILDTNGNGVLDAADQTVSFGQAGDIPVVGDWRGTGRIALGLYRHGTFILDLSGHLSGVPTGLSDVTFSNFGLAADIPIVADWSGSGKAKVGVFRDGTWLVDYSGTGMISQTYTYGQAGDVPVVGDWDSSGNPPKIGVYRSGIWILDYDGDHVMTILDFNEMTLGFGFAGYTPLVF
jgi:hypothetical protein